MTVTLQISGRNCNHLSNFKVNRRVLIAAKAFAPVIYDKIDIKKNNLKL